MIISNAGAIGVEGIDVPISGSFKGKGIHPYHVVDENGGRTDLLLQ
jgi:hypothetical protein